MYLEMSHLPWIGSVFDNDCFIHWECTFNYMLFERICTTLSGELKVILGFMSGVCYESHPFVKIGTSIQNGITGP